MSTGGGHGVGAAGGGEELAKGRAETAGSEGKAKAPSRRGLGEEGETRAAISSQNSTSGEVNARPQSGENHEGLHYLTSIQIFRQFMKRTRDPVTKRVTIEASGILSRECYEAWLASRRLGSANPQKSFQRSISAHVTGVDGRAPFTEEEEIAVLHVLRKKEKWPCFEGANVHFGRMGFRALGFHERKRESGGHPASGRARRMLTSSRKSRGDGDEEFVSDAEEGEEDEEEEEEEAYDDEAPDERRARHRVRKGRRRRAFNNSYDNNRHKRSRRSTSEDDDDDDGDGDDDDDNDDSYDPSEGGGNLTPAGVHDAGVFPNVPLDNPLLVSDADAAATATSPGMGVGLFLSKAATLVWSFGRDMASLHNRLFELGASFHARRGRSGEEGEGIDEEEVRKRREALMRLGDELVARASEEFPLDAIVCVDLTERNPVMRYVSQNAVSYRAFGSMRARDGGTTHVPYALVSAWRMISNWVSAYFNPGVRQEALLYIYPINSPEAILCRSGFTFYADVNLLIVAFSPVLGPGW